MSAQTLRSSYKEHSGYRDWDQRDHAEDYLLFPGNLTPHISIDEVSLSRGELYTFVTAKDKEGKNGRLIAAIKDTKASTIAEVLGRLDATQRQSVREVSMDMAKNMEKAIKQTFTEAQIVTDRFHVIQLIQGCMQQVRIALWRKEMNAQNKAMGEAKKAGRTYIPEELANGDTPKQLLARVRYQLHKHPHEHKGSGKERIRLAFNRYPELDQAYRHAQQLRAVYTQKTKEKAQVKFDEWIESTYHHDHESFYSAAKSLTYFKDSILAYYHNLSTNAGAESFNAKLKLFRTKQRGVRDTSFFLFRLTKLYA